jgi:hypothetical protein
VLEWLAYPSNQSGQALLSQLISAILETVERGTQVELRWLAAHDPTEGNVEVRSLLSQGSDDPTVPIHSLDGQILNSNPHCGARYTKNLKGEDREFQKRARCKFT